MGSERRWGSAGFLFEKSAEKGGSSVIERINPESVRKLLTKAISINSIFPHEQEIVEFLAEEFQNRGFSVDRQEIGDGRANLLVEKGKNARILFSGHSDTVDLVKPEEWKTDPFAPTEIDGMIHGLGASDMKSGFTAAIEAVTKSKTPAKILLTVDEESEGKGAYEAIMKRRDFFEGIDLIISGEPDYGFGLNGITNARPGGAWYRVVFKGIPSMYVDNYNMPNATRNFMKFGDKFYEERDQKKLFKSPQTTADLYGLYGKRFGMSLVPEAGGEIEVLWQPEDTPDEVLAVLQKLAPEGEIKPNEIKYYLPYSFEAFPYQAILGAVVKQHTGEEMELHFRPSLADDNILAALGKPIITWGPVGYNEHAPNENVNFESVVALAAMYKKFLDSVGELEQK